MHKRVNALLGAALTAALCVPAANAATTFIAVGSSAVWQTAALAAYTKASGTRYHYTVKGTCGSGNCAQVVDQRKDANVAVQGGNLWVVWDSAGDVWADLSVDSVVGDRSFFSVPRAHLQTGTPLPAGENLIAQALWADKSLDTAIPANVVTEINAALTAAFTDIRPEDALFATNRAISTLGYKTSDPNVGEKIFSTYTSGSFAQPVLFALSGKADPITKTTVPPSVTIPIGASPIIFFANKTAAKANLGTGLTITSADDAFSACGVVNKVDVTTVVREPISGTMNTTEYTTFLNKLGPKLSQETGIPPSDNPVDLPCGDNTHRTRAIGTGDMVGAVAGTTVPSIGYSFFGYGNFSKIANNAQYQYFTLQNPSTLANVDPIFASYTTGELPACTAPCPITPGKSFPNLRNGSYTAWSLLRAVTDGVGSTNYNTTNALVSAIDANINSSVPDFVPYLAVGGDPGLQIYRSHYLQSGVQPNNGINNPNAEAGGDMGGCIEPKTQNVLSCTDF